MRNFFNILLVFTIFFYFTFNAFSAVEIFTAYDTKININKNNTIDVEKKILLRNIHDVGIVPGQVEFKINTGEDIELQGFEVYDRYGSPIKSSIRKTSDYDVIMLNIFTPVLPGFEYKIDLKYTLNYNPNGLLFKRIELPLKENTRIPIKKGTIEISIPEKYKITHTTYSDNSTILEKNSLKLDFSEELPETINIEYSRIPLRLGGVAGSIVFWLTVNILLILILGREVKRELRKLKNQEEKHERKKKK
ncbi:MAG: hypothetical protein KC589_09920 [Nanoarchaeota archaeon]|nr:hypothetical protein [Nanoarchaeota archaeon]